MTSVSYDARSLLLTSHSYAKDLSPQEEAYLLTTASSMAAEIDPELCRQWSEELFFFAFKLPPTFDRVSAEKNGLVSLSQVNATRAFELFPLIEPPIPFPDSRIPEDVRADAATTIFVRYWKQGRTPAKLIAISDQADKLGNTGQYPYLAMAAILQDIAKPQPEEAESVLLRALSYYRRGSLVERENEDFLEFLESTWADMPPSLRRSALSTAVERLTSNLKSQAGVAFSGSIASRSGQAQFQSKDQMILWKLLPRIEEVDPRWAAQLVQDHAFLKGASNTSAASSEGEVTIRFDPSSFSGSDLTAVSQTASQSSLYNSALAAAANDPDFAMVLSGRLDNARQASVYSRIAIQVHAKDPIRAAELMDAAEQRIKAITDPKGKFDALVPYLAASSELGDWSRYNKSVAVAYDLGDKLAQEDIQSHPRKFSYQTVTYPGLEELSACDVKAQMREAIGRIDGIEDDAIRANLLAEAAYHVYKTQGH